MSDHPSNFATPAALGIFSALAGAAVAGYARAQAHADAAATDDVVDEWYAAFDRQAETIAHQVAVIAGYREEVEILRAELATAHAR